jgi:alcohol dehydrogenase (cytochrome c)
MRMTITKTILLQEKILPRWLCIALLMSCAVAAVADENISPAPAFSAGELRADPQAGWLTNGGNLFNQRYSPLAQINTENIAGLKGVWRASLGSGLGPTHNNQGQPLIHEGVLYIGTGENDVFAIAIDTGKLLWTYKAKLEPKNVQVCCAWVNRGVGIGEGRIFHGQLDAKLVALDQRSGEVVWSIQAEPVGIGFSITSAPLYYNGMVIVGFAGADMGTRGRIKAYSAKDGALLWTYYTIPAPGEPGSETWPADNDSWKYGGASIWMTPAVDPELGLLYFGTGNPAPDLGAAVRPGDNLFSDSIMAIEIATGKYRWHFQEVHHDIWDYDAANPVILFDAEIDGRMRKGIAHAGKTGWVYLLDRETGEPLLGMEERPVPQEPRQATAPTQPYPVGDAVAPQHIDIAPENVDLVNQGRIFTPFFEEAVIYKPLTAVNWPPSSYDPETHLLYMCANDAAAGARANDTQYDEPSYDRHFFGGSWAHPVMTRRGIYTALDVRTNRIVWQRQWADRCRSGSLATAGGLVFVGRNDGRLMAMDKRTGKTRWEFLTDSGINTGISSFEYRGDQYIAAYAGGARDNGTRGDAIWLFSLKGALNPLPPQPTGPAAAAAATIAVPERTADRGHGKTLYLQSCVYCHGEDGEGTELGGARLTTALTIASVMNVLNTGRNAMPNFSVALSADDMHDIGSYIIEELVPEKEE